MSEDNKELIEFIDKKFQGVALEFVNIHSEFVNVALEFVNIHEKLATKADKKDIDKILSAVDAYAKKADKNEQEILMLGHQGRRYEKWFQKIAAKLGIKLEC